MTGGKWRVTSAESEKLAELEWQVWARVGLGRWGRWERDMGNLNYRVPKCHYFCVVQEFKLNKKVEKGFMKKYYYLDST